jgi:hypothetical protein
VNSHADGDPNPEAEAALALGRTWNHEGRSLQLLTTYEQRIRRSIEKNTAELRALQAARKAAIEQAEEKARLLVQLAEYEAQHGRNYDPVNDFPPESYPLGFVFSRPAVLRRLELNNASNRPKISTGVATSNPTTRIPTARSGADSLSLPRPDSWGRMFSAQEAIGCGRKGTFLTR